MNKATPKYAKKAGTRTPKAPVGSLMVMTGKTGKVGVTFLQYKEGRICKL